MAAGTGFSLYVSTGPGESRTVLCRDGRLLELVVERDAGGPRLGDIVLGRVAAKVPGTGAVFVDIGAARPGYLPLRSIDGTPSLGAAVVVQVIQEALAGKGAKLSGRPTIAGRFIVYTPGQAAVRLSRRIAGSDRDRLSTLMGDVLNPEEEGAVLRTSAAAADEDRVLAELDDLRRRWAGVAARGDDAGPPARLLRDDPAAVQLLRDGIDGGLGRAVTDSREAMTALRGFCERSAPEFTEALEFHDAAADLFESAGIEEQVEAVLDAAVGLPSGGCLTIEETSALTAIDVDSAGHRSAGGRGAGLAANLEAAVEIARQVRLRSLGGLILCDMIGMGGRTDGARVLQAMSAATADDPAPVRVAGFTRLGLIEMTRERRRAPLSQVLGDAAAAGRQPSGETCAYAALRAVRRTARREPGATMRIAATAAVLAALKGPAAGALKMLEADLGRPVTLREEPQPGGSGYRVDAERPQ